MGGGFYYYGFTAFFIPVAEEFEVGRGTLSLVFGLAGLEGAALGPLQGWVVDRYGPRRIMFAGIAVMGTGFLLLSYAQSIVMLFVYFIVFIAIGAGMGLMSPSFAAVANWFIRRRGAALGIAMSGIALGAVLVSLTNFLVETYDWRGAARIIAILVWVIGFPLASLMRHRPEQYGMLPDGAEEPKSTPEGADPALGEIDFTAREALATSAFWLIHLFFLMGIFVRTGISVHFIPAMDDKGLSATTAAALLGVFGLLSIPGRFLGGLLGDLFEKRVVTAATAGVQGVAMLLFAWADGIWQITIFLVIYAAAQGGAGPLMFAIRGEYFGRRGFATIGGLGSMLLVFGTIGGPVFAGFSYDATNSYRLVFLTFAGISFISMVPMLLAKRPVPPRPKDAVSR